MPDEFDQILARGRLAAGEWDLQHADLGKLREDFLPFFRRELAAAAVEVNRIGAIGALQRAAMRQFGEHGQWNSEGFRRRASCFQRGQAVIGPGSHFAIGENVAHAVLSRASVRKPLSARSCSMAMTSVAIAPRSAAYLMASWSTISATLRTPSQSCSTSTAISSGASTRSGARITQTCRVSSNFSLAWRGKIGRLASLTVMLRPDAMASLGLTLSEQRRPAGYGRRHRHDTAHPIVPIVHWS